MDHTSVIGKLANARRRSRVATIIVLISITAVLCGLGPSREPQKELITITHIVTQGETLWGIGAKYCTPDRYILEFIEGIYELNYDSVFSPREKLGYPKKMVIPGDRLQINYWIDKSDEVMK